MLLKIILFTVIITLHVKKYKICNMKSEFRTLSKMNQLLVTVKLIKNLRLSIDAVCMNCFKAFYHTFMQLLLNHRVLL